MLKTLKTVLLVLITSFSFAQNVTWQQQPFRYQMKMLKVDSALIIPRVTSLLAGFNNKDSVGMIRYFNSDNLLYLKTTAGDKSFVLNANVASLSGLTLTLGSDAKWDTWYRDSTTNNLTRLAAGTFGQFNQAGPGGKPKWHTLVAGDIPSLSFTQISGIVPIAQGGTALTALGSDLQQLRVNAGATALEYFTPSTTTLQSITSTTNGNNTNQLIQIKGLGGAVLPGYALELFMDSTSTPKTGNVNAINRPSGVPIELRLNYLSGTYASPATVRLGGAGNDITVVGGNAIDSGHTNLIVSGSHSFAITTITNSTVLDNTYFTVLGNNSSNITVTLPTASSCTGRVYHLKKISNNANTITINAATGVTIDGSATATITTFNQSVTIQSSGTAWFIL
jgi:hypothetical protein